MTCLSLTRHIRASLETVFDAITTPEGIAAWWGPDAGPVLHAEMETRIGGHFRVRFRMLDDTVHECSGQILEFSPPTHVAMSWQWLGRETEGRSRLEIRLQAIGKTTELTLTHTLLPNGAAAKQHAAGWSGSLDKLVQLF